jgi:light-regulated signal transduction histidine kinase (bacteriophytochrome)
LIEANQEMEAFTYSVAHDLRAPLRHIDAFAQMLQQELSTTLTSDSPKYLERIRSSVQVLAHLVDSLLTLARIGRRELNVSVIDLNRIVQAVVTDFQTESAGREVEWKLGHLPATECDPDLMRQVFENLISNALKYSRPRRHAVIEIGHTHLGGEQVIFVRDNGVGFDMKFADKLFGVFQRLHRSDEFEGTGVGLATVDRIVRKHGGRIWAEAALEKGATFYFTLGAALRIAA